MKRFTKTLVVAAVAVATVAAILMGCKKEQEENTHPNTDNARSEPDMTPTEQKVMDFLAEYDALLKGEKTEGEPVCIEEARWYWETAVNYCYGYPEKTLCNLRMDTISVTIPKPDDRGLITYADMLESYGIIVSAIRDAYKAIDAEGKTLQLVIMKIQTETSKDSDDNMLIIINTGSNSYDNPPLSRLTLPYWYEGPFDKDDDWIWGLDLGKCDGTMVGSDAADQLTLAFANYDALHGSTYIPCPDCYTYFLVGPNIEMSIHGTSSTTWPFFDVGLTNEQVQVRCIPGEDLEMYYEEIMQATHTEYMDTNPYYYYGYYKTEVIDWGIGMLDSDLNLIKHIVNVLYATRIWRSDSGLYPTPIDEDDDN